MPERSKHTLVVVNPGHFHAALTLRRRHPLLADEVYVYAEDGPELKDFLRLVDSFNRRVEEPTSWRLHIYRGPDYLDALLNERPGNVVIIAGKNNTKLNAMQRLHAAGMHVLGDKTWLIDGNQLDLVREITASPPLAMDIMTERYEIATRLQQSLCGDEQLFGGFFAGSNEPAVYLKSVHHLYKEVNGEPLVRPAWYFDSKVQGEGITDVTTHLVDLVQWMVGNGTPLDYDRDVELSAARQWPTEIPRETFTRITGLNEFPPELSAKVQDDKLHYLCNASLSYRLRGIPVGIESLWALTVPKGGGDTHHSVMHGTKADLVIEQGPETSFVTELRVRPGTPGAGYEEVLARAVNELQDEFPGLGLSPFEEGFRIFIPDALRTGHESHFAQVLEQFLTYVDRGRWPANLGPDLVTKYTLLARARELAYWNAAR